MSEKKMGEGLRGIVAGKTVLSTVGQDGKGLTYRGYAIEDLEKYSSYEETAYLILEGKLPNQSQLDAFNATLASLRGLDAGTKAVLEQIPATAHPMNVIACGVNYLGTVNPEQEDFSNQDEIAMNIMAKLPSILLYWYHHSHNGTQINTDTGIASTAQHVLQLLHGEVDSLFVEALDSSLVLYTEHEFNASTFTGRIISSTLSDLYSSVAGAIGALRGPLHGGANEKALELLHRIGSADRAVEVLDQIMQAKEKIMGFGHAVYSDSDPRSEPIKSWAQKLTAHVGDARIYETALVVEKYMWDAKKLFPNTDFYHAPAYEAMKIPTPLFTPLFAVGRSAGWIAHIKEQRADNRIIRPNADYVGDNNMPWVEIAQR